MHGGELPEPLGVLHSSPFPHIPILRAGYEVLHECGLQEVPWEVPAVAGPPLVLHPEIVSVVVKIPETVACPEREVNSEAVVLNSNMKEKGCWRGIWTSVQELVSLSRSLC